jgi:hypothetical protein
VARARPAARAMKRLDGLGTILAVMD